MRLLRDVSVQIQEAVRALPYCYRLNRRIGDGRVRAVWGAVKAALIVTESVRSSY